MGESKPTSIQIDTSQRSTDSIIRPAVIQLNNVPFYNETAFHSTYGLSRRSINPFAKEISQTSEGNYNLGSLYPSSFSQYFSVNQLTDNPDLRAMDAEWLSANENNNLYFMLYDGWTPIFYRDPISNSIQYSIGYWPSTSNDIIVNNLDPFWTAVGFVRDYLIKAYESVKKIENLTNAYPGETIGNTVYLVLDFEVPPLSFNGWWNCGFRNNEEAETYVNKLAEIIETIRFIMLDPVNAFNLNGNDIPESTFQLWMDGDLPWGTKDITKVAQFYKTLIEALPHKYREVKVGVYGIPDLYEIDAVSDPQGSRSGGWYGEDITGDKQSKVWNYLPKASRDIINNVIVDKYKVILDAVDFITPSVYAFEPVSYPAKCDGVGTNSIYSMYKLNLEKRNLYQQYTYDNVRRAVIYNKKYNKNKPILPMITPVFYGGDQIYIDYCNFGAKRTDAEYTDDKFVLSRFVDVATHKDTMKYCYEAASDVGYSAIKGFLIWNSAASYINYGAGNTNPFTSGRMDYNRKRKVYSLDIDTSKNPTNNAHWSDDQFDAMKIATIRKSFSVLNQLRQSSITLGSSVVPL